MGTFSVSNLIKENNNPLDLDLRSCEESYFLTSLEFCRVMNEEFEESNKIFYRTLLESGDDITVINEGFSEFFDKIKDIIKKFIEFLKKLFARFNTALHSLVNSDKYLKKHEKDFAKFNTFTEFEMDLYTFTIEPTIPIACAEQEFEKAYDSLYTNFISQADFINASPEQKVAKLKEKYRVLLDDVEDTYDEFRAKVIGDSSSSGISASDYSEELFKVFRDNDDTTFKTTVDSSIVNNSLISFKSYDKTVKVVKERQKALEKDYKAIEKAVEKMFSEETSGNNTMIKINGYGSVADTSTSVTSNAEIKSHLDMIAKSQANKVTQFSSIHTMAFGAKLDAITDRYKQDKKILYKALSEIQRYEGKEGK